jgi:hypothetical protein
MNIEIATKEYEKWLNWHDAKLYCELLTIDGKMDWRLPTKDELNEIYNSKNDFVGSSYWSSTEYGGNYAWLQRLSHGPQNYGNKNNSAYVRAVRSSVI